MKKIISISLTFFIVVQSFFFCFYSTPVYGTPLDVDLDLLEDMASNPEKYEPASMKLTEFLVRSVTGGQALDKFFGTSSQELISNIKALFLKEGNCKTDGNNYYLTQNFTNEFNKAVQGKVHALNGYWLFEPAHSKAEFNAQAKYDSILSKAYILNAYIQNILKSEDFKNSFFQYVNDAYVIFDGLASRFSDGSEPNYSTYTYVLDGDYSGMGDCNGYIVATTYPSNYITFYTFSDNKLISKGKGYLTQLYAEFKQLNSDLEGIMSKSINFAYGSPFKIFYSVKDLQNFLDSGKKIIYAPKLPSTTISIPIKYINNSVSLPDITYNINTTNKTEVEIQNEYNTTLNNYLNDLNNFTDGSEVTPTPTPDGGFTDGTTPTPKPDFGDDSNPTDTNDWLKKIYEWLQSFGDTHSKFEKTITDYIEANDGKLDQIIEAINSLSDGKTEDEKNGCKYDFTTLSDFMTKLWNESDKKFDKMVELLEENNKYQKKLVNSLNEIKAILVTQTIMDVFQDRSKQTAEKAKDKFPTSLPWDIALVVNAMSAEPEKPQFDLPIQIKSLNINEEIHVDLASGEWEKLAKTCRYLLSILFILLMIQLSRKLFSNGGDD